MVDYLEFGITERLVEKFTALQRHDGVLPAPRQSGWAFPRRTGSGAGWGCACRAATRGAEAISRLEKSTNASSGVISRLSSSRLGTWDGSWNRYPARVSDETMNISVMSDSLGLMPTASINTNPVRLSRGHCRHFGSDPPAHRVPHQRVPAQSQLRPLSGRSGPCRQWSKPIRAVRCR